MAKYERSEVQDPLQNDLNADGNDLTNVGSVDTVEELINLDAADLVDGGNTYPSAIRAANEGNSGGLLIQSRQSADAKGDPGYQANIDFVSGDGERIARVSADRFEPQINWYLRPTPMDGSFGTPQSRMTLNGLGNDSTSSDRTRLLVGNYDGGSTAIEAASTDGDATIGWRTGGAAGDRVFRIYWDVSRDYIRFRDEVNGVDAASYRNTEQRWHWQNKPMTGLREISNPTAADLYDQEWAWDATNGRWLFKDSGGAAHYFTPDGTL